MEVVLTTGALRHAVKLSPQHPAFYMSDAIPVQGGICRGEAGELPPHWI